MKEGCAKRGQVHLKSRKRKERIDAKEGYE